MLPHAELVMSEDWHPPQVTWGLGRLCVVNPVYSMYLPFPCTSAQVEHLLAGASPLLKIYPLFVIKTTIAVHTRLSQEDPKSPGACLKLSWLQGQLERHFRARQQALQGSTRLHGSALNCWCPGSHSQPHRARWVVASLVAAGAHRF